MLRLHVRVPLRLHWFILCTWRLGGAAHEGEGCDQAIGSTVSDATVRSWLWLTATRSSLLGCFSTLLKVVDNWPHILWYWILHWEAPGYRRLYLIHHAAQTYSVQCKHTLYTTTYTMQCKRTVYSAVYTMQCKRTVYSTVYTMQCKRTVCTAWPCSRCSNSWQTGSYRNMTVSILYTSKMNLRIPQFVCSIINYLQECYFKLQSTTTSYEQWRLIWLNQ